MSKVNIKLVQHQEIKINLEISDLSTIIYLYYFYSNGKCQNNGFLLFYQRCSEKIADPSLRSRVSIYEFF